MDKVYRFFMFKLFVYVCVMFILCLSSILCFIFISIFQFKFVLPCLKM